MIDILSAITQIQDCYKTLEYGVKLGLFDKASATAVWYQLKAEEKKYATSNNR